MQNIALEAASTETVRELVRRESETRLQCVTAVSERETHRDHVGPSELRALVCESVEVLEGVLFAACSSEVLDRLGIKTFAAFRDDFSRVVDEVRHLMRMDPMLVVHQTNGTHPVAKVADDARVGLPLTEMLSTVRSMIASWPIRMLEAMAIECGAEHLAHRARTAYDGLRSFLNRNDPEASQRIAAAGRAYARGHMPLEDVAVLLGVDRADAIALLQEHGYCRSLDTLRLEDDARARILASMREDRLRRAGRPAYSRELVARDVIASERMEGVDVRSWIRPTAE